MANPCVFCGDDSARLTDEHVFAAWITDFYAERVGKLPYGTVEMGTSSGEPRQFRTVPFQQVVKIVCAKCNNGWMASLEGLWGVKSRPVAVSCGSGSRLALGA